MDAAAELGRNPVSEHQIQPEYGDEQADAGRDGRTVSRDQILRRERGQVNIHFPRPADHEQDWQPYPVDPYSAICVTIHGRGSSSVWHHGGLEHRRARLSDVVICGGLKLLTVTPTDDPERHRLRRRRKSEPLRV